MAPNGFLHAASVIAIADTAAGYGSIANLPTGASGFTTIELKSNHLGTALDGTIECVAKPVHLGKTTQVWDAVVTHRESGKTIALFRCTRWCCIPNRVPNSLSYQNRGAAYVTGLSGVHRWQVGIKENASVLVVGAHGRMLLRLEPLPDGGNSARKSTMTDIVHIFTTRRKSFGNFSPSAAGNSSRPG